MGSIAQWWMWPVFLVFVGVVLSIDIFASGRGKAHRISLREAANWCIVWMTLAFSFAALFWWYLQQTQGVSIANEKVLAFLTGYLIELSLSVDNMFVFLLIFQHFSVPAMFQRRVLVMGVLGAIFMRLGLIMVGVWVVAQFHWILYLFGAFLVFTGIKMLFMADEKPDLAKNPLLLTMRKYLRITDDYHEEQFFIRRNGLLYATPLFLILVLIEFTDLVFALDSIPAIFAITNDPFIIFTSNIFAILGLRALYFLLSHMADKFHLLKYGVALVLTFVGAKMLLAPWVYFPMGVALGVIVFILGVSIVASVLKNQEKENRDDP